MAVVGSSNHSHTAPAIGSATAYSRNGSCHASRTITPAHSGKTAPLSPETVNPNPWPVASRDPR